MCLKKSKILLNPEDYYTQRNNPVISSEYFTIKGHSACMPTARVMFYIANGITYNNPSNLPDDAYFTQLLISKEACEFAKIKYPWAVKDGKLIYPPNEIHGMYGSWLDEKVTGKRRTDFKMDLRFEDYIVQIKVKKHAVMTSGSFDSIDGHALVFVGYDKNKDELIAVDPYGNPHKDYKGEQGAKGYGIRYSLEYFDKHIKKAGKELKYGHIIL